MRKKLTQEEFIENVKKKHFKENYDYSLSVYIDNRTKTIIICNEVDEKGNRHGNFEQTPSNHLFGQRCPKCHGTKVLSTEEFIYKATKVHGDLYDYSKSEYINNCTKLIIICNRHGEFLQRPMDHLSLQAQGCPKCGKENAANKLKYNKNDFIIKAIKISGNKYDYSNFYYKNYNTKGLIICNKLDEQGNIHGEFLQAPCNHLLGKEGCPKCFSEKARSYQVGNIHNFTEKASKIHNYKYDYSKFNYLNARSKSIIICPKHGDFLCSPDNHLREKGCPACNESKGEKIIRIFIENNDIKFKRQKTFNDCRNPITNRMLKFDFYLCNFNICIEFDGPHHFMPVKFTTDMKMEDAIKNLKSVKKNDKIKTDYCKNKNIPLLRIHYTKIGDIKNIISWFLKI